MYTEFLLKETINSIVDQLGLDAAIAFLQNARGFIRSELSSQQENHLLAGFLLKKSSEVFETPTTFNAKGKWQCGDARMACCFVFQHLTGESLNYIAEKFAISRRACQYSIERCRDRKSLPAHYQPFLTRLHELEKAAAVYLSERFKSQHP